jgi:hypothetical protein
MLHAPYHNPFNQATANRALSFGVSVEDLTNVGLFLESLTTLGPGSSFSDIARLLGRADEIYTRFTNTVNSFHTAIVAAP